MKENIIITFPTSKQSPTFSKFVSPAGFATQSAKKGDLVPILRDARTDKIDPEMKSSICHNVLDDYVYPEIQRRLQNNVIKEIIYPMRAHIIFYQDSSKNEIRINEETKFTACVNLKEDMELKLGQEIPLENIEKVRWLKPTEDNNPNAAHLMIIKIENRWEPDIRLIYNARHSQVIFQIALQFYNAAEYALKRKEYSSFIGNLFYCVELLASAQTMSVAREKTKGDKHKNLLQFYRGFNVEYPEFTKNYERLYDMRLNAIYPKEDVKDVFMIDEVKVQEMLEVTKKMIETLKNLEHEKQKS
ncbi:MAG: HEPN domain-containing protein [Nitrosopumilaceae archaeon]